MNDGAEFQQKNAKFDFWIKRYEGRQLGNFDPRFLEIKFFLVEHFCESGAGVLWSSCRAFLIYSILSFQAQMAQNVIHTAVGCTLHGKKSFSENFSTRTLNIYSQCRKSNTNDGLPLPQTKLHIKKMCKRKRLSYPNLMTISFFGKHYLHNMYVHRVCAQSGNRQEGKQISIREFFGLWPGQNSLRLREILSLDWITKSSADPVANSKYQIVLKL